MARYWDNKEIAGRGTKFCFVVDPEDGTHPIRTYGWTKEEVLEKLGKTAESAQQVINRQRATVSQPRTAAAQPAVPPTPARPAVTAEQRMQATADLQNPAKSSEAIKTLLRAEGLDLDKNRLQEEARRAGAVAQEWERSHPDFPSDERNQRLLMNTAVKNVGGLAGITTAALDTAYEELLRYNMLFEVAPVEEGTPPAPPNENSASVTRRQATSYRAATLRAPVTPVVDKKPKYTRAEIDDMNSKVYQDKFEHEPGFKELVNSYLSTPA